ncbi:hypothetical protein BJX68DRAFT_104631 [Aspergillus pseudodeflectus]|uniref:Secreted protein n=1 Tax=Aspergillus pseudodeflectus TaxID=176178 RepID=A0ABR4K7N4_9EURO
MTLGGCEPRCILSHLCVFLYLPTLLACFGPRWLSLNGDYPLLGNVASHRPNPSGPFAPSWLALPFVSQPHVSAVHVAADQHLHCALQGSSSSSTRGQ